MDQVGAPMLGSGLRMQVGIDVLQESFFTFEAHHKCVVLINLAIQLLFTSSGRSSHYPGQPPCRRFMDFFGDGPVKHGSNAYSHLIFERAFRKQTSTSMATNLAHDIDSASYQDYKKDIVDVPAK
jgi:hypothetical protein